MGGKRIRLNSKFQPKKCAESCDGNGDRISQLPDEVLVFILSFLQMEEAARTSVLSSRWINLWKHTDSLIFDDDRALDRIAKKKKLRRVEKLKFKKWVNCVLQSHKSLSLKEFRICFDLGISNQDSITQWLEYAFSRQVQWLELDFTEYKDGFGNPPLRYDFPEDFLTQSSADFKFLKALSLKCVNVSGEAIEFFLRNCPLLEQLVVDTDNISNLEVCVSSLTLKHLEMRCSYAVKSLKVSAPRLTSLNVNILEGLLLENIPMLVDVTVTVRDYDNTVKELLRALSCCISQLEILKLILFCREEILEFCNIPVLPKVKKLVIDYLPIGDENLHGLTPLIRACPYLQEFVLQLKRCTPSGTNGEAKDFGTFPHSYLKVVEIDGYYGYTSIVELVRFFLENCVVLEKIILDPRFSRYSRVPVSRGILENERIARNKAQQLEAEVPKHIEFVIL